ncbi:calmodulin-binding protein 60 G-like [Senna tora]|uniref:Calmodulin-binding protein 60 G-like n=1 Tax=Senna tora TaxID=362788 RepID=A0A834W0U9_9FABA|nr:calmodulin-binding protein 60 G-like [Senna tora]
MGWMKKFVMKKNMSSGTHVTEDSSSTQVPDTSEVQPTHDDQEVSFEVNDDDDQEDPIPEEENEPSNSTRTRWLVEVIDNKGIVKYEQLSIQDVWVFPLGTRVVVPFNELNQHIGNAGGLLSSFLGIIGRNFRWLPLSYKNWRDVPKDSKNEVYHNQIQAKFVVNDDAHKHNILKSVSKTWKDGRAKLYHFINRDKTLTKEVIAKVPDGISREHWASFVDYRMSAKTMDKILSYESSGNSSYEVSQFDSLAMALGSQERSGRVRGMGLGPTPSQVFGVYARSHHGGTRSTDPSYSELQNELARMRKAMDESEERNRRMEAKMVENDERNRRMDATIAMLLERFRGQLPMLKTRSLRKVIHIMASKRQSNSSEIPVQEKRRRHEDTKQNTDGNDMKEPDLCMCTCTCTCSVGIDYSRIESIIRRVVRNNNRLLPNESGVIYELRFINEPKETYFTHRKILSENEDAVQIAVYDVASKCIVKDGPFSSIKIEICAVDGDFGSNLNWSSEEFNSNILRPREGKKAILKGDHITMTLKDGIGFISELEFIDNSCWVRTGKFRLAAKCKDPNINIREAITKPFIVKDKRGEAFKKRPQPDLNDKVWCLRNIGIGGNLHKQLSQAGIETVKDLMRLYTINNTSTSTLKEKFGRYKWEDIIKHGKECVMNDNEHYIYNAPHTQTSLVFNSIYEVEKVSFRAQNYRSPQTLNSDEKEWVELVKQEAYKNQKDFIPIELKELAINPQVQVEDFCGASSSRADHPQFDDVQLSTLLEQTLDWESPLWEQPNTFNPEEFKYSDETLQERPTH